MVVDLIENQGVEVFYFGNQGSFDRLVKKILSNLKQTYPNIKFYNVLAYLPTKRDGESKELFTNTIIPDGLENVPPKYAISYRNKWMIKKSDFVVTYVRHTWGGAAQFKEIAEKSKKQVINI